VAEHGIDAAAAPYRAARDLLLRRAPRAGQVAGAPLQTAGEDSAAVAVERALALDDSTLPIQGPPGSGKTYTGAQMVLALVAAGRKVGVTANSHKVIGHLLDEIASAAEKGGVTVRIGQKPETDGEPTCAIARCFKTNGELLGALRGGELDVVGGTAWVWSREDFAGSLDVLVVDEAGQIALANALAVSPAARSLILLGDPQQLEQPLKGTHPPGAERSALAHLLDGAATMPAEKGLFLARTWRLHPDVCAFTSKAFYAVSSSRRRTGAPVVRRREAALRDRHALRRRRPRGQPERVAGRGGRHRRARHVPGRRLRDLDGPARPARDPRAGRHPGGRRVQRAGAGARAPATRGRARGTVDKFQGQEAAVSIYSMASSSPADAPRGMEFLYSLNRLNVATSRARCLAAVVASPELFRVRCRTPRQMQLANGLCLLLEMATTRSTATRAPGFPLPSDSQRA
jgi:uncharacterized protein